MNISIKIAPLPCNSDDCKKGRIFEKVLFCLKEKVLTFLSTSCSMQVILKVKMENWQVKIVSMENKRKKIFITVVLTI